MTMSLDQQVAAAFQDICEVESVFLLHRENVTRVFTVINEDSEDALDQIAALELALGKKLTSIRLDFNTIARRNRPIQEFLSDCIPAWSRSSCQHLATI